MCACVGVCAFVCECVCMFVRVRVCVGVCLCVGGFDRSRSMKLEYIVVYENISGKFVKGHIQIKVRVMVGL